MDIYEICNQHYFHEVDRRQQLTNSISVPSGVLVLLGGASITMLKVTSAPYSSLEYLLLLCLSLMVIAIMASVFMLMLSIYPRAYHYIPTPKQILEYRDNLIKHYETDGQEINQADKEAFEYVHKEYANATDENTILNDKRTEYLGWAHLLMILSLIIAVPSAVCYVLILVPESSTVTKICFALTTGR